MKVLSVLLLTCLILSSCAVREPSAEPQPRAVPSLPPDLEIDAGGRPLLQVYVQEENLIRAMDIERYVEGVVAGEMQNDWPLEALKAQAILARTFVLRFVSEKESRYEGADVSTDIAEAQAYSRERVNEHIRRAVQETAGLVLLSPDGTWPYTWFHAHSGGTTALAREALGWQKAEPSHTKVTPGLDSDAAPASAKAWEASFTKAEFLAACRRMGVKLADVKTLLIGEKGESGRAVTLLADGQSLNAARLRIELGSTVMRSTLLTSLDFDGKTVAMAGRGYGHGVGMPQWGAYALAQDGLTGEDIALHYYQGLSLQRMWPESLAAYGR